MTRRLLPFALALLTPAAAFAQHFHHHHVQATGGDDPNKSVCSKPYATPVPKKEWQGVPWDVHSTHERAAEVKLYFNQGMTFLYGFNYEDALRNFRRAVEIDESFVMGWWGKAMAAGPNINIVPRDICKTLAQQWSQKAFDLAGQRADLYDYERDLAFAVRQRYAGGDTHADDYAAAMKAAWDRQLRLPTPDPNVGALYAESLLDLHPWDLYDQKGNPRPWTQPVLDVLTKVIETSPKAVGANHYWIHAVEAGKEAWRAIDSAKLLDAGMESSSGPNWSGSGHLLHMPSHTWLLTGRYRDASASNTRAIDVDRGQFEGPCAGDYGTYIKNTSCLQLYYGHYYSHNLYFRAVAEAFAGQADAAIADAHATHQHAARFLPNEPGLQRYMAPWYMLLAAHGRWDAIGSLTSPPVCPSQDPGKLDPNCHIAGAMWRWARGMRLYTTAPKEPAKGDAELAAFRVDRDAIPEDTDWSNNKARSVLAIAEETLLARQAWAAGDQAGAIKHLELAVVAEDALKYDEPPQWVFPARQWLGGANLALGTTEGWKAAVNAFCLDLRKHPENGRSLYGVGLALYRLGNPWANTYGKRYLDAWGDSPGLTENALWLLKPVVAGESPGRADAAAFGPSTAPPATDQDPCSLVPSGR